LKHAGGLKVTKKEGNDGEAQKPKKRKSNKEAKGWGRSFWLGIMVGQEGQKKTCEAEITGPSRLGIPRTGGKRNRKGLTRGHVVLKYRLLYTWGGEKTKMMYHLVAGKK